MAIVAGTSRLTYQEYAQFPDDGKRHEIIDGAHYVSPAPSVNHQRCAWRLVDVLAAVFERTGKGEVLFAPVDVELTENDIVQPDFVVVLSERASIIEPSRIVGAPDLVVEIVSPSSRDHDTVRKLALYERTGVGEYWIVDRDAERLTVYSRSGARFAAVDAGRGRGALAARRQHGLDSNDLVGNRLEGGLRRRDERLGEGDHAGAAVGAADDRPPPVVRVGGAGDTDGVRVDLGLAGEQEDVEQGALRVHRRVVAAVGDDRRLERAPDGLQVQVRGLDGTRSARPRSCRRGRDARRRRADPGPNGPPRPPPQASCTQAASARLSVNTPNTGEAASLRIDT